MMKAEHLLSLLLLGIVVAIPASVPANESVVERTILFEEDTDGFRL